MSKESSLFTVGVLVLISPFLGLPVSVLGFMLPILGIIILSVAYALRKERVKHEMPAEAPSAPVSVHEVPSAIA